MDFIVKLPPLAGSDSISVVVDHMTKGAHLVPAEETWLADAFAIVLLDRFIRLLGLPDMIVTDRSSTLVS